MSAGFESGFFYREPAWHGEGVVLDHVATAEEALRASATDWTVQKSPLFLDGNVVVPRNYAVVRETDQSILGVVGAKYTPLQNRDAFAFFDNIVTEGAAIYHTAGSLMGGKKVWILAKLPDHIVVNNTDNIEKYILITNSHDGNGSIVAGFTPVRVVCQNTLNAAINGMVSKVRIRHTRNAARALSEAHRIMGIANQSFDRISEMFEGFSRKQLNIESFKLYLDKVFPTQADNTKRMDNIKGEVTRLFEGEAKGHELPGFDGHLWGAYNSIAEYVDFRKKSKNRLFSVWMGQGSLIKERAFSEAVKLL
jgi:phage/plasmid-like protein (TIGR03299 family)